MRKLVCSNYSYKIQHFRIIETLTDSDQEVNMANAFLTLLPICVNMSLQQVEFKRMFKLNFIGFSHMNILVECFM